MCMSHQLTDSINPLSHLYQCNTNLRYLSTASRTNRGFGIKVVRGVQGK